MLVLLRKGCSRLSTSSPHTWLMTSGGRSFHLERSDPIQPGQPASGRRQHPAGHRRGEVGHARVAPMRVMKLPEIHSPASPQPGNSARRPPGTERVSSPPPWRILMMGAKISSAPIYHKLPTRKPLIEKNDELPSATEICCDAPAELCASTGDPAGQHIALPRLAARKFRPGATYALLTCRLPFFCLFMVVSRRLSSLL